MKFTVALIYGGEGFEHEISLIGAKNVLGMIDREKYEVIPVFISKTGEWFIENGRERTQVFPALLYGIHGLTTGKKIIPIDVAVPLLHGDFGEDGIIIGLLKAAHIKYVGCDVLAGAVCADKTLTKFICDAIGIPTAKWTFSDDENAEAIAENAEKKLGYPMFIKPASLGSSIGISKVSCRDEFISAYKKAHALSKRVLIEEAVSVKNELECAYLSVCGKEYFKTGEILAGGEFYDYDRKYLTETKTETQFNNSEAEKTVIEMADKLRLALGIRQISRFDFFLTENGEILFNEINTFPGMTKTSLYPLLTEKMGFSEGEFINRLISEALL